MICQSEAARTAAQFLSFGSFFLSCPLGLWDSCLFAQISFDRVLEDAMNPATHRPSTTATSRTR
ncbi:hypothetical protein, partial [Adlercreutzia sp. DFI.6.23]|uniref:hypothetical protein n=1 Tax=Adlercreutzia sp. DFI.6.23 TaxID=2963705 RepID=UPI002108A571